MSKVLSECNARELANSMTGRRLRCGAITVTVAEVKHYPRSDTEKPLYRPLLDLSPLGVRTSRQYNSVLCHILAKGGGCVSIRAVDVHGAVITGPGRVSETLGLTAPNVTGRLRELGNGDLVLDMDAPVAAPKAKPVVERPMRDNGISEAVLRRHMAELTAHWKQQKPRPPFPEYLRGILERCRTEGALRQHLAGRE